MQGTIQAEIELLDTSTEAIQRKLEKLVALREEYERLTEAQRQNLEVGGQMLEQIEELRRELTTLGSTASPTWGEPVQQELKTIEGGISNNILKAGELLSAFEMLKNILKLQRSWLPWALWVKYTTKEKKLLK
ncbi:MAG: hypothetical protein LUD02_02620 [Tannerellaceae bacterium]|nr:hypothetical protein [Tannerellaceae bacterium]